MTELLEELPSEVMIYEVAPRDGLQNESASVSTLQKLRLVEALMASGLRRIELTSFVRPLAIPQLADADDLAALVKPKPGVSLSALIPNERGLERAIAAGLGEVAVFVCASETDNERNARRSVADTLELLTSLVPAGLEAGLRVRGYVSDAWGCPYEGRVEPRRVSQLARRLADLGCYEVALVDIIGVATPTTTGAMLDEVLPVVPPDKLALHLHDTRGMALSNVLVGLERGIRSFDAAVAGLGGCPYAPGAAGNLATEDLLYMLQSLGIDTGVDPEKLWEAGRVASSLVSRELPGRVHRAGLTSLHG